MRGEYEGYTPGWRIFDIAFGLVAPILVLAIDPWLYRSTLTRQGWVQAMLGIQALSFAVWLLKRRQAGRWSPVFGVSFLIAFACSAALGACGFDPSDGIFLSVWGWFGVMPWFAAWVYLRNAQFAFEVAVDLRRRRVSLQ